jgi:hypothetical protein
MKKQINALIVIGIIGTAIFGANFAAKYAQANWGNKDIWWTPMSMALPLNETQQEFELYIKDELLQKHLEAGALSVADKTGKSFFVGSDDIKIRLNNWNKMKSSMLNSAAISAFSLGISLAVLILGVVQFVANKEEK